jgi:hypothetical protein
LLAVKSGFILFIKNYQFPLQINTLEREREREWRPRVENMRACLKKLLKTTATRRDRNVCTRIVICESG